LNEAHGITEPKRIAYIEESQCIGCKLCIKACPVDCIVGAGKLMHTVISKDCTGCKLCIPVCPTDCIDLVDPGSCEPGVRESGDTSSWPGFTSVQVQRARLSTQRRLERIEQFEAKRATGKKIAEKQQMQQEILAAVNRRKNRPPT
jgi:electron transport complex protein RnfB